MSWVALPTYLPTYLPTSNHPNVHTFRTNLSLANYQKFRPLFTLLVVVDVDVVVVVVVIVGWKRNI